MEYFPSFSGNVENWSCGEMKADFALTVGMAYFNDTRSVWEPLIEPVVKESTTAPVKYIPWSITANIAQRKPVSHRVVVVP